MGFLDKKVFYYVTVIIIFIKVIIVWAKDHYSAMFSYIVGWHASAVSLPPSDVILAQLACLLSDVMFCLQSGITNLSLYKHWYGPKNNSQVIIIFTILKLGLITFAIAPAYCNSGLIIARKTRSLPLNWGHIRTTRLPF